MEQRQEIGKRSSWREEIRTALALGAIALLMDVGYASWRAVAETGTSAAGRLAEFGEAFVWPGLAIFAVAFVVMWLGWRLELD